MSFEQQLAAAVTTAATFTQIDNLSRAVWKAHAAGLLDDAAAQAAAEGLEARKALVRGGHGRAPEKRAHGLPRRPPPRSPDKEASLRRRRSCAASGAVPAAIAACFTMGEAAVLSVVAGQVRKSGDCRLPIDALAALSGTSRSTVKRAIRAAQCLGLVEVEERPQPGRKSLTNIIRIIGAEWRSWLRLTHRGPKANHHVNSSINKQERAPRGLQHSRSVPSVDNLNVDEERKCRTTTTCPSPP